MKKTFIFLLLPILICVYLLMTSSAEQKSIGSANENTLSPSGTVAQKEEDKLNKDDAIDDHITDQEILNFRAKLVSAEDARKEVQGNPHGAPHSIVSFAETLGGLMEKGLKSETDANILIEELRECALNTDADVTVRALCLSHSEKLTVPFPELNQEYEDMRASVTKYVRDLADARKLRPR